MSRTLLATICLGTAMIGGESATFAAEADESAHTDPRMHLVFGRSDLFGDHRHSASDPDWLMNLAATDPSGSDADTRRTVGRFSLLAGSGAGSPPHGAAAVLDLGVVNGNGSVPDYAGIRGGHAGLPRNKFVALLGAAVGLRFDSGSAGAFSNLSYARYLGEDPQGSAYPDFGDESLTGSVGLQTTPRFETAMGVLEPQFSLSLDHDFDIDDGAGGPYSGLGRRNIYVEERDVTEFDMDNAIGLRMKGFVPGWFRYETRVRVRLSGLREVTGRIRFRW